MSNIIAIGGDHAGFTYKQELIEILKKQGFEVKDFGPFSDESVDYPDFIHPLCNAMTSGEMERGIIICGSGNGVAITANKHQGIRAAICWNEELAALSRQHNDANLISIPARFVSFDLAKKMVDTFLSTEFEGGRHARRVDKIACK
ncbi:ribose 5-phosphate isomerase B [Cyclobacterium amurskyense]|jgi:ribose 5-phosphate isomerase B|uniref:Ribose 5-phosphate isomerase B n=1 Tax=Cyclobacterium amurskyense TaxID=320787 RepID=A0A0H4PCE4_9BACT|nr:ribose 5-phosphate isomerase B [Cyclobacterium amurskyense]AKP50458.1 Ribose 5-phosphate isomerase B [Cyclobacterium amurskyense]|tara:strand:+ start:2640 stop:3077 length:438 start_codon:yes stop_codon:yes gene_type:complete